MPAHDECEPAVIAALEKAGFRLTNAPYTLRTERPGEVVLYADLRLVGSSQENQVIIVIEVKCFPNINRALEEIYTAIGQYMMYRTMLDELEPDAQLYLAIPDDVYRLKLSGAVVAKTLRDSGLRLIVIDMDAEVIVSWHI